MNEANKLVEMEGIIKRFGRTTALDGIDVAIPSGRIVGLVGANGSGKSTLLRHIVGLYLPDQGHCRTFGTEAAQLTAPELARIGYVHQEGELLEWMTVKQLLRYVAAYYPTWNLDLQQRFLDDFEIPIKLRVGTLSPGKRQQVAILLAIAFEPDLLILDEPASGLDPIARSLFLDLLLGIIQDQNRTIIISSHILSDIEKVIDHVLIMQQGRLLRDCGFDQLQESYLKVNLTTLDADLPAQLDFPGIIESQQTSRHAVLTLADADRSSVADRARTLNCQVSFEHLSLEEIYKIVVSQPPRPNHAEAV